MDESQSLFHASTARITGVNNWVRSEVSSDVTVLTHPVVWFYIRLRRVSRQKRFFSSIFFSKTNHFFLIKSSNLAFIYLKLWCVLWNRKKKKMQWLSFPQSFRTRWCCPTVNGIVLLSIKIIIFFWTEKRASLSLPLSFNIRGRVADCCSHSNMQLKMTFFQI